MFCSSVCLWSSQGQSPNKAHMGAGSSQINWILYACREYKPHPIWRLLGTFQSIHDTLRLFISGKALVYHFSLFLAESSNLANSRYNTTSVVLLRLNLRGTLGRRNRKSKHQVSFPKLFIHIISSFLISLNIHSSVNEQRADSPLSFFTS